MQRIKTLLLIFGLLCCAGCQRPDTAPTELVGTWRTDAAGFEDRFISIEAHYIVFGAGEDTHPNAEYIEKISLQQVSGTRVFFIQANDMGRNQDNIELEYTPANPPQLRLTNRKQVVWRKTGQIR